MPDNPLVIQGEWCRIHYTPGEPPAWETIDDDDPRISTVDHIAADFQLPYPADTRPLVSAQVAFTQIAGPGQPPYEAVLLADIGQRLDDSVGLEGDPGELWSEIEEGGGGGWSGFAAFGPQARLISAMAGQLPSIQTKVLSADKVQLGIFYCWPAVLPAHFSRAAGIALVLTFAAVPTVNTVAVTAVTMTSAASGGNVTADGGAEITARGVCWTTSANPTIEDSHTTDGTGVGEFVSGITGLLPSTIYHVRAYATNSVGTCYGEQVQFTTAPEAAGMPPAARMTLLKRGRGGGRRR